MNDRLDNPVMQNHWSHTLETLIDWLAINDTLSDAVVVRRLVDIIRHAPHPDLIDGVGAPDPATVDHLLAAGAADALALRLIGSDSGFFASRGASGEYLVSVVLPGRGTEMTAAGPTLTRAIVCALAMTLSQTDRAEKGQFERGQFDKNGDHPYAGYHPAPTAGATLH